MQQFPTKVLDPNPRKPHPGMPKPEVKKEPVIASPDAVRQAIRSGLNPADIESKVDEWSFGRPPPTAQAVMPPTMLPPMNPMDSQPEQILKVSSEHRTNLQGIPEGGFISTVDKNANYYSVSLPSEFTFYDFKNLSVSLIRGRQQAKFNRAAQEHNSRYMIEGVTSLLGDNANALSLTTGDFYWLLYWLLYASYPTRQRRATVICQGEEHLRKVEIGELQEDTLKNELTYDKPLLKEVYLDNAALASLDLTSLAGLELDAYRVKDMLDWEENFDDKANAEDYFTYDLAVYLKNGTLEERAEIVRDMNSLQIDALTKYREVVANHGVEASLKSVCKECGAETEVSLSVSAHDFL